MGADNQGLEYVHDLRVLVSAIQLMVDEVLGAEAPDENSRELLRDQVDLLAEILRVLTEVEQSDGEGVVEIDVRAIIWACRARHQNVFMGKMGQPIRVRSNIPSLLELMDMVVSWVAAEHGRVRIVAVSHPAALMVLGATAGVSVQPPPPPDREIEQTILSLAGAARVEASLKTTPRSARLDLVGSEELDE